MQKATVTNQGIATIATIRPELNPPREAEYKETKAPRAVAKIAAPIKQIVNIRTRMDSKIEINIQSPYRPHSFEDSISPQQQDSANEMTENRVTIVNAEADTTDKVTPVLKMGWRIAVVLLLVLLLRASAWSWPIPAVALQNTAARTKLMIIIVIVQHKGQHPRSPHFSEIIVC